MSTHPDSPNNPGLLSPDAILPAVENALASIPFIDIHTHLFTPALGSIGLWGIDDLITYHYLEAELFRFATVTPEQYWEMPKRDRADLIWRTLFIENAPISEATRGVTAVLQAFGLPTSGPDLNVAREFFAAQELESHIRRVFGIAGISEAVMTNDPLDPEEAPLWERGIECMPEFHAVLRLDRILNRRPRLEYNHLPDIPITGIKGLWAYYVVGIAQATVDAIKARLPRG